MIKDGIEYTKCPACERICLKFVKKIKIFFIAPPGPKT